MKAQIITIGNEILIGQIVDSNSAYIGKALTKIGVDVVEIKSIKDQRQSILDSLEAAKAAVDLVIITGGLGPTNDDITKSTFCEFFADTLVENPKVLQHIKQLFGAINEPILPANISQALLPSKATALHNAYGTAPGMWVEEKGVVYVALPGVPYEMRGLIDNEVIPRLKKQFKHPFIVQKTVLTYGVGESRLAAKLETWEANLPRKMELAYLPAPGSVRLRLTDRGEDEQQLRLEMTQQLDNLQALIGDCIKGYEDDKSWPQLLGERLAQSGKTLAIAESCTGGKLASLFTEIPGASAYFKGGIVAYDTAIKSTVLGVSERLIAEYSVVSAAVARAMAKQTCLLFNADYALATTGNAGPTKGDSDAEVGTVFIALATAENVVVKEFHLGNLRKKVVEKALVKALQMLDEASVSR